MSDEEEKMQDVFYSEWVEEMLAKSREDEEMKKHKHRWQYASDWSDYGFFFVCECGEYKEVEMKKKGGRR